MNYQTLIDLGFKRIDCKDNVHFKIYGWDYFILTRKLTKNRELSFSPSEPDRVRLLKLDKQSNILLSLDIYDEGLLRNIIAIFG